MLRKQTTLELADALRRLREDPALTVGILTGAGDRFFCIGGEHEEVEGYDYAAVLPVVDVYELLDTISKPVIAAVNGYAIGGGHVLHVICDVTIAVADAKFGQVGPKVGSFDAGYGSAYLARVVGEKRAREIWFRCRQYDAATAERWGLVNEVVPRSELRTTVRAWADDILALSPTALRFLKQSFNADTEHIAGIGQLAFSGLGLYLDSDEANEGVTAFNEKRAPDFRAHQARGTI
jgi:naphthoate synthase